MSSFFVVGPLESVSIVVLFFLLYISYAENIRLNRDQKTKERRLQKSQLLSFSFLLSGPISQGHNIVSPSSAARVCTVSQAQLVARLPTVEAPATASAGHSSVL